MSFVSDIKTNLCAADESLDAVVPQVKLLQFTQSAYLGQAEVGEQVVVQRETTQLTQGPQCTVQLGQLIVAKHQLMQGFHLEELLLAQLQSTARSNNQH